MVRLRARNENSLDDINKNNTKSFTNDYTQLFSVNSKVSLKVFLQNAFSLQKYFTTQNTHTRIWKKIELLRLLKERRKTVCTQTLVCIYTFRLDLRLLCRDVRSFDCAATNEERIRPKSVFFHTKQEQITPVRH